MATVLHKITLCLLRSYQYLQLGWDPRPVDIVSVFQRLCVYSLCKMLHYGKNGDDFTFQDLALAQNDCVIIGEFINLFDT